MTGRRLTWRDVAGVDWQGITTWDESTRDVAGEDRPETTVRDQAR